MMADGTHVALLYVADRANVWLRFGCPETNAIVDPVRRVATFRPGSVFCRVHWQANEYGTTRWELSIIRAPERGEGYQRISGVVPGGILLLQVRHAKPVRTVLRLIDAIEATGVDPVDVASSYWRVLQQRTIAHLDAPTFTTGRHQAYLLRNGVL
jgi:hypothetical protein